MKILAIDTSSFPASAAVAEDGIILAEYVIRNKKKHSQNIMVMVERLLDDLSVDIKDIDLFAVTVGPGSFTGLRIGISTVRAFAQAAGKKCVGVNTLEAAAFNFAGCGKTVVSILDALRNEVFAAAYEFDGLNMNMIMDPCVADIEECVEKYGSENVIYTGDGTIKHSQYLKEHGCLCAPCNLSEVRASSVAALAALKAEQGGAEDYGNIIPMYLRKSQAEREYENKTKKTVK